MGATPIQNLVSLAATGVTGNRKAFCSSFTTFSYYAE
jgi:hypothetical protein